MQDAIINDRLAYLDTRVEGNDRIWFVAEWINVEELECLPHLIVQKRNNILTIDNNAETNGGFNFVYYKWFRIDEFGHEDLVHEGAHGTGLGGVFNVGRGTLSPYHTYYALLIDQNGEEHRTCPYNPTIFIPVREITAYPNPTTTDRSLVVVDVETDDEELLANGVITVYNVLGYNFGQVRTNGHRITPVRLPEVAGTYLLEFISGNVREVIRVIVY